MLRHSHAGRVGLKLLLVQHTVYLTRLAAWRGGAGPAGTGERYIQIICVMHQKDN